MILEIKKDCLKKLKKDLNYFLRLLSRHILFSLQIQVWNPNSPMTFCYKIKFSNHFQGDICTSVIRHHGVRLFGSGLAQIPDPNVCRLLSCNFREGENMCAVCLLNRLMYRKQVSEISCKIFRSNMLIQFRSNCFISKQLQSTRWCCYRIFI